MYATQRIENFCNKFHVARSHLDPEDLSVQLLKKPQDQNRLFCAYCQAVSYCSMNNLAGRSRDQQSVIATSDLPRWITFYPTGLDPGEAISSLAGKNLEIASAKNASQ
jgi:hypothetical protein